MVNVENQIFVFQDSSPVDLNSKTLRIIHFNDVYNIEGFDTEPFGGAARFKTAIDFFQNKKNLVLFSGDAFSPSTLSLFSKGTQMIECLNKFKINAAVVGNHEFDMGVDIFKELVNLSNFPWILTNLYDAETMEPFLDLKTQVITNVNKLKIGIIGLAEKEWVCSLSAVSFDDIIFESFVHISRKFAAILKKREKCDVVIALTHMRWKNDIKLAEKVPEIDLILGGHDHDYEIRKVNNCWIIKSGSDFKEFSVLELEISDKALVKSIKKIIVDSKIPEDREIKEIAHRHLVEADNKLDEELGIINKSLDGLHDSVRTRETNLGNFLCDIIMSSVEADCAILNGGSLRSDKVHQAGPFTRRDLRSILPFDCELVVVYLSGKELHELLESCLSNYELKGGRFPQVSGLFFTYCIANTPGNRVNSEIIKIQEEYLDMKKIYRVATNTFLKNVEQVLKEAPIAISSENIPFLYTLVENYFKTINSIKNTSAHTEDKVHRPQIVAKVKINNLITNCSKDPEVLPRQKITCHERTNKLTFRFVAQFVLKTLKYRNFLLYKEKKTIKLSEKFRASLKTFENKSLDMSPECENRSIQIKDDKELEPYLQEKHS